MPKFTIRYLDRIAVFCDARRNLSIRQIPRDSVSEHIALFRNRVMREGAGGPKSLIRNLAKSAVRIPA